MNLLNTAICETKEGDLLIVWGGRRIVTQCLTPPLIDGNDPEIERVWKRRYRWDTGNFIVTRIYDNYTKRMDYVGNFGRNPAIIQDQTGRIWIGYRIPVISSQDPTGALSNDYVVPKNIATTAGMNFWQVLCSFDLSLFTGAYPFDWQEQVAIPVDFLSLSGLPVDYESLDDLLADRDKTEGLAGVGDTTLEMFTDWTWDRITGELMLRGMGGNVMDMDNPARWRYNESEGLGRTYPACIIDDYGRQVRLSGNQVLASYAHAWDGGQKVFMTTTKNYGLSGNVRLEKFGRYVVSGYNEELGEIPWQIEDEFGVRTVEICDQAAAERIWAIDNSREWVLENANVPEEGYFSWEEPPTPEQQNALSETLRQYYYALPTLYRQRAGLCIGKTGLIFLCWTHGNQTIVPVNESNHQYKAVGMRLAVSADNGTTFEPLVPDRAGYLQYKELN